MDLPMSYLGEKWLAGKQAERKWKTLAWLWGLSEKAQQGVAQSTRIRQGG